EVLSGETGKPAQQQVAALALPFGARADWQQWDSFLTNVVKKLGENFSPDQRDQLSEVFLDARYQLVQALSSGASDPVPQLFTDTWGRLAPVVKQAIPGAAQQTASQYTSFIGAMDAATSFSGIGQRLGIFRITPDALRGAAKLLGAGGADPLAYLLDVDTGLRGLLGFTASLPDSRPSRLLEQGRIERLQRKTSAAIRSLLVKPAYAAETDFDRLNEWVPETQEIPDYLLEVRQLLADTSDRVLAKSNLPPEQRQLYRQIVFATGWQESCWRQFIKKGQKLTPLASSTGDVGLMQVNRVVWRSLYDIKGLNGDMSYNGNAGAEILYYYLTRYAIRKGEDKQPGGHLARATYSAYNAGPGGLGRYRGVRQSQTWKKVDEAFWTKFQAVSAGQELAVKSCYGS
ncbi:MAG TPA: lytic transglycosylase domain-containing protein, partial [Candidatus Binatia bacterium]|nr:lytic transglycosylase domain-containing protein [Candidatus Binatia bacterium]